MKRKLFALSASLLAIPLLAGTLLWSGEEEHGAVVLKAEPGQEKTVMYFNYAQGGGAWLGVTIADVDTEKVRELKLPGEYGALVKLVTEDSPAAKAGLEESDVILEFAGEKVRSAAHLRRLVSETPPGRSVPLVISRAGQTRTVTVELEKGGRHLFHGLAPVPIPKIEIPDFDVTNVTPDLFTPRRGARLGISGDELTPQLAEYFGVKEGKGILVREVVVGSAAEKAGLKAGDVIVRVDDKQVDTVSELRRALAGKPDEKQTVKLAIVRDRQEKTVTVELEPLRSPAPRQVTEIFMPGMGAEALQQMAAELREQAKEIEEQAREAAKILKDHGEEFQKEMQRFKEQHREKMKLLRDEYRDLRDQIQLDIRQAVPKANGRIV